MIDLRNNESSLDRTVTRVFHPDTGARRDGSEALALTEMEFDSVRTPNATGWRHFLRLQGFDSEHAAFNLKIAAQTLAELSCTPNDFLELLARVHADVGHAPAAVLPVLYEALLGHLSQMKGNS